MKKLISVFFFIWLFVPFSATTVEYVKAQEPKPMTISELIAYNADKYDVSRVTLKRIIKCESGFNPKAHNLTPKENSYGLVQINLKAHKTITKSQALSPDFSIDFLAKNLSQGNGKIWSCYES